MSDDKDRGSAAAEAPGGPDKDPKDKKERDKQPPAVPPVPPAQARLRVEQPPPAVAPPPAAAPAPMLLPTEIVNTMARQAKGGGNRVRHLVDCVDLDPDDGPEGSERRRRSPLVYQPILIVIDSLRANAKVFISIRDDQRAAWSESDSRGLVGFSISSTRDPAIYMRSFLINSREMYVQSYRDCQEIQLQLYVHTAQQDLRGRLDLPPGTSVTLQTGVDRTSLIGLSSFTIEFPPAG